MSSYQAERYYIAYGKKYRNIWQAYKILEGTEHNVEPVLENSTFKNLKGTKINLDYNYEQDLLNHIAWNYKHTTLLYSAGVDSHTIAVHAKRCNIRFNKILTFCNGFKKEGFLNRYQVNDDTKNFFDKRDNVQIFYNSLEFIERAIMMPEWWMHTPKLNLGMHGKLALTEHYNPETLYISGKEKPSLYYYDSRWYMFFTHDHAMDNGHLANNLYFFGLNSIRPEISIQQARRMRDYFVKNFGTPSNASVVHHKMFLDTPKSNDFITGVNNALGRYRLKDEFHEHDQTKTNNIFSRRGIARLQELSDAGRIDIVNKFLEDCKSLYDRYPQIEWEWPMFVLKGRIPWLMDIDSLDYLPGSEFANMQST